MFCFLLRFGYAEQKKKLVSEYVIILLDMTILVQRFNDDLQHAPLCTSDMLTENIPLKKVNHQRETAEEKMSCGDESDVEKRHLMSECLPKTEDEGSFS